MITNIYRGSGSKFIITPNLDPTILFMMVVFDSIESRDEFARQFPKSLNITSSIMSGHKWDKEKSNLASDANGRLIPLFYPYCSVRISEVNKTTGHSNEVGYKRMNRFYSAILKQYDIEGSIDLADMMEKYALTKIPEGAFK